MNITVAEVKEKLERGDDFVLLDVREPEEVAVARIEGSLHVPMGEIPSRMHELDPEKEIVVFCHAGIRSERVRNFLRAQDFTRISNMVGGIDAWARQVDPSVPLYRR